MLSWWAFNSLVSKGSIPFLLQRWNSVGFASFTRWLWCRGCRALCCQGLTSTARGKAVACCAMGAVRGCGGDGGWEQWFPPFFNNCLQQSCYKAARLAWCRVSFCLPLNLPFNETEIKISQLCIHDEMKPMQKSSPRSSRVGFFILFYFFQNNNTFFWIIIMSNLICEGLRGKKQFIFQSPTLWMQKISWDLLNSKEMWYSFNFLFTFYDQTWSLSED